MKCTVYVCYKLWLTAQVLGMFCSSQAMQQCSRPKLQVIQSEPPPVIVLTVSPILVDFGTESIKDTYVMQ